jgi:GMP synthase (glutamine-hydrolysing)
MNRCVILRHVPFEGPGSLAAPLRDRGWSAAVHDVTRPEDLPAGASEAGLVLYLGGPDSVYDHPAYLEAEIALARRRVAAGRANLGICLGAQVLAAALGAGVRKAPAKEIGWYPIELERDSGAEPVAAHLAERTSHAFHWHGDTFDLPPDAVALARSRLTENQGFRYGALTYGLQFHPEITAADLVHWIEGYRAELDRTPEAQSAGDMVRTAEAFDPIVRRQAEGFMNAYLAAVEAALDER